MAVHPSIPASEGRPRCRASRAALWRPSGGDKTLLSFFWRLLIQGLYFTHLISIVSCILFSAFIFSIYLVCDLSIRIKDHCTKDHCTKNDDIERVLINEENGNQNDDRDLDKNDGNEDEYNNVEK